MAKKDKKDKTFNICRRYLVREGLLRKEEGRPSNLRIIQLFCKHKKISCPPTNSSWRVFRKLLIENKVIEIPVQGQKKKVRVGRESVAVTSDMSKIQVAEIYRRDLVKYATTPEKKIRSLLYEINRDITPIEFIFQKTWTDTPTKEFYISDFFLPSLALTIEVDGESHLEEKQIEKDRRKEDFLKLKGIRTIRLTNKSTYHIDANLLAKKLEIL